MCHHGLHDGKCTGLNYRSFKKYIFSVALVQVLIYITSIIIVNLILL